MAARWTRARLVVIGVAAVLVGTVLASTPAPVAAAPEAGSSDWRLVSAGISHTCGIRTSGRLYCWGSDANGQLGDGGGNDAKTTPTAVAGGGTDWVTVTTGWGHTCARRRTGRLYCWGNDDFGQLGDGSASTGTTTPNEVAGGRTDWAAVSAGYVHTCARRSSGRLFCWGYDGSSQLGDGGTTTSRDRPTQVAGNRTDWAAVSAGRWQTCALRTSRRLFCWGENVSGVLGNGGTPIEQSTPGEVVGGRTDWASVSTTAGHACARRTTGRLYCWGNDFEGELGDGGANTSRDRPTEVAGNRTDWTAVNAGYYHTCARRTSGRLFCWGYDGDGQVGDGTPDPATGAPDEVQGGATDWTGFDGGERHTCALITSGRLFCWGLDDQGQLGDSGTNTNMPYPVEVFP